MSLLCHNTCFFYLLDNFANSLMIITASQPNITSWSVKTIIDRTFNKNNLIKLHCFTSYNSINNKKNGYFFHGHTVIYFDILLYCLQKQPLRGVLKKRFFWKNSANLQENTYAEVWFQESCKSTFLKSHFGMGIFL